MNDYNNYISDTLLEAEYLLAKDLNNALKEKFNLKNGHERKIVQRAVELKIIHSTSPVTFGKGQFVYLHHSKSLNKEMILQIAKEHRPGLFRIIKRMDFNKGIISFYEACKLAACPLDGQKNKSDTIEKLLDELRNLELGELTSDNNGVQFIVRPRLVDDCKDLIEIQNNNMELDSMFIPDILRSLKRFNIIDNNKVLYRNKNNSSIGITHNNFLWDVIAYTKTTGINEVRASEANNFEKQTLVVLDIVVSRPYSNEDLQGFYNRIQSVLNSVKTGKRKVMPIIIFAETESRILINRIKKLGFMSFDLGSIYGSRVYEIIKDLIKLKNEKNNDQIKTEDLIEKTLSTMKSAGQEENLNSIKGDLFESLMYPVIQLIFPHSNIEPGRKLMGIVNETTEGYEYDYIVNSSRLNEIVIFELKGYASSNYISLGDDTQKNTLKWFFNKTLPFATKILRSTYKNHKICACYITTSGFKEDGESFLKKINSGKLKSSVELDCWYDGTKLIHLLDKLKFQKVKEIVLKYFIKDEIHEEEDFNEDE